MKRWLSGGIVDQSQALAIRSLYSAEQISRPWALIVFSGIGAVIIGLGIVLLFAYNWQEMTKAAKLSIIFSSLIISHGTGIWLFRKSERYRTAGEALTILGSMLFGAGIWLVAQIYHIDEHFPTAFLIWGIGTLILAWAMPSIFQAIMAAILFTIWTGTEVVEFNTAMHWAIPLIVSIAVFAYMQRSWLLLSVLVISSGFILGFLSSQASDHYIFPALFSLAVLYISFGSISRLFKKFPQASTVLTLLGSISYFIMLYLITFHGIANELLDLNRRNYGYSYEQQATSLYSPYLLVPLILALIAWLITAGLKITKKIDCPTDFFLSPMILVLCYWQIFFLQGMEQVTQTLFNVAFLAHAGSMMARGCFKVKLLPATFGSLMIIALVVARYFDLFENLAIRGLVFIAIGAALFAQGFFYLRSKKKLSKEANI